MKQPSMTLLTVPSRNSSKKKKIRKRKTMIHLTKIASMIQKKMMTKKSKKRRKMIKSHIYLKK